MGLIDLALLGIVGIYLVVNPRALSQMGKKTPLAVDQEKPKEDKATQIRAAGFIILMAVGFGVLMKLPTLNSGTKPNFTTIGSAPAVNFGLPVTEEECREFGKKLAMAIVANDQVVLDQLFRLDDFVERCIGDLELPGEMRSGFSSPVKKGGSNKFLENIIEDVKQGGTFSVLHIRTVQDRPRVLMRHILANGGVNYLDFTLARFSDGRVATEDIYIMVTGEMMSQTCRRMILHFLAEHKTSLSSKLTGIDRDYTQSVSKILALTRAVKQGQHQEALNIYRQLPVQLQKDKAVQLRAMEAAQGVDDDEYLRLVESYRQNHPQDPSCDINSIDYYTLKKGYEEALTCVTRIDKAVGGDAYLSALRGSILTQAGRFAEARIATEGAVKQEPKLEMAYWWRIDLALKEKNHGEALVWLKRLVEQCHATMDEERMKKEDIYADFLKTPQCKEILDWQKARQK